MDFPSVQPFHFPSRQPSLQPVRDPTLQPARDPTSPPTSIPTSNPSAVPASFLATFLIVNLTSPVLLSAQQQSLLYAVASSLDLDASGILYIGSASKAAGKRRELSGSAVAVATTLVTAPASTLHRNSSMYADQLFQELQNAVASAVATKYFRSELNAQLGNGADSNAAIIAVARGDFVAFPTLQPTVQYNAQASKSSEPPSAINQALLLGLVFGIFAIGCTAVPVYLVLKRNLKKKDQEKDEIVAVTETESRAEALEPMNDELSKENKESSHQEIKTANFSRRGPPSSDPSIRGFICKTDKSGGKLQDSGLSENDQLIIFAPNVNLEPFGNASSSEKGLEPDANQSSFSMFYELVQGSNLNEDDADSDGDADTVVTAELVTQKRDNSEFEVLLAELKHQLNVDSLASEQMLPTIPATVTHREFSRDENETFELLLQKVKAILQRDGDIAAVLGGEDKELIAAKMGNELLLQKVKSFLVDRQSAVSIADRDSFTQRACLQPEDIFNFSQVHERVTNPKKSERFREAVKGLIPDIYVNPLAEVRRKSKPGQISGVESAPAFHSCDFEDRDSHDIDYSRAYNDSPSDKMRSKSARKLTTKDYR